ncbi:MAG: TlpA family protein disulfide reductase [Acidimicrobiales bacterium]|jgi:thiol-disulfide isomerase/thioredoxin|nr:TlpA family protein disulfide reductase [Acidimicrobiales bacterium]
MPAERHPDDLPPLRRDDLPDGARGLPRGLVWATALGVVVLAIASWTALRTDTGDPGEPTPVEDLLEQVEQPPAPDQQQTESDAVGVATPGTPFERADGSSGTLADYRGRPLVVNFFGSWCGPCITEMPMLEEVHQATADQATFLGLNVAEPLASGLRLVESTGVTYDVASDADGELLAAFGLVNLPATVVLDADGEVARVHTGIIERSELEGYLAELTP